MEESDTLNLCSCEITEMADSRGIMEFNYTEIEIEHAPRGIASQLNLISSDPEAKLEFINTILTNSSKVHRLNFESKTLQFTVTDEWKFQIAAAASLKYLDLNKCYDAEIIPTLLKSMVDLLQPNERFTVYLFDPIGRILNLNVKIPHEILMYCLIHLEMVGISRHNFRKYLRPLYQIGVLLMPDSLKMDCLSRTQCSLAFDKPDTDCTFIAALLRYLPKEAIVNHCDMYIRFVFNGFKSNTESVKRSHIYSALIERLYILEWEMYVLPVWGQKLLEYEYW